MLRIGDISLYDIGNGIVGTGELKTKKIENQISITTNITSKVDLKISNVTNSFSEENKIPNLVKDFPKLEKQLKIQEDLLKIKPCEYFASQSVEFEYELLNKLSKDNCLILNSDKSLLLFASWSNKESLYDILSVEEKQNMKMWCQSRVNTRRIWLLPLQNEPKQCVTEWYSPMRIIC